MRVDPFRPFIVTDWDNSMAITITVNGQAHSLDVERDTPLLWAIRDTLGLTGTKFGCGISACGACTVHLDGRAIRSCTFPISAAEGAAITTIEGLAKDGTLHKVQQAWVAHQVPQCGYCQSGMIMAVSALLEQRPKPSDDQIDATITNICRCGTFARVRRAEPYRVCRRAFSLRGWSHVTTESVFPRSTRASGAAGPRARG